MSDVLYSSRTPGREGPLAELAEHYSRLDMLKTRLDSLRPLPPEAVKNLRDDMVLRYTYHSNAIEGNTLTLQETKVVLEDGLTIGGRSMHEHLEAVNHREAIVFLEELAETGSALSEGTLKELHRPFVDGNGRTARLIMNLELLRSGFPVVIIPVDERSAYFENLDRIAAKGDYVPFVEQVCGLVEKSFEPYWFLLSNGER